MAAPHQGIAPEVAVADEFLDALADLLRIVDQLLWRQGSVNSPPDLAGAGERDGLPQQVLSNKLDHGQVGQVSEQVDLRFEPPQVVGEYLQAVDSVTGCTGRQY